MVHLDRKVRELIGIGAAVVAHCRPCLERHLKKARELGITEDEIQEVIELARKIRSVGISTMDEYTNRTTCSKIST